MTIERMISLIMLDVELKSELIIAYRGEGKHIPKMVLEIMLAE